MTKIAKLEADQITKRLGDLPDWSQFNSAIQRTFNFPDFVASIAFVNKVALEAERVQHHPDILIRYDKVTLTLSTHDAGGLTDKDFDFAAAAEGMV